jgi:hypothetical protein
MTVYGRLKTLTFLCSKAKWWASLEEMEQEEYVVKNYLRITTPAMGAVKIKAALLLYWKWARAFTRR